MDQRIIVTTKEELFEIIRDCVNGALKDIDQSRKPMEQSEYIGTEEAAALVGLSKSAIFKKTHRKEIPHRKMNRRLYFRPSELIAWIESGRRGPQ